MVRNGFFIGKRILSAFALYARLASHDTLLKKTHMLRCARSISRQRTREYASAHRSSRALPLSLFDP
jgi:hypothetical protein